MALDELAWGLSLGLLCREGWNDHLRIGTKEEVAQNLEVRIQTLDAPLHRECINGDHHALIFGETAHLGSDVLVYASNDTGASGVATESGLFGRACVTPPHYGAGPAPLESFLKHIRCALIKHAVASAHLVKCPRGDGLFKGTDNTPDLFPREVVHVWCSVCNKENQLNKQLDIRLIMNSFLNTYSFGEPCVH